MKGITLILFMVSIGNCKSASVEKERNIPIIHFSHRIDLKIQDNNGNDLLNPEFAEYYCIDDIWVYESDDAPNAICIEKNYPNKDYYLQLALNLPELKKSNKKNIQ